MGRQLIHEAQSSVMKPNREAFPSLPEDDAKSQATYWLTLMNSGLASEKQLSEFQDWLDSDPAHQAAWKEAEAFWNQLDRLDAALQTSGKTRPVKRRRALIAWHWAQAAMLVLGIGFWAISSPWLYADYATASGESRSIDLIDGSHLQLNTRTVLSFDTGETRRLRLYEGEVFIQVAADPAHPFVVETPTGAVRALGTAFEVRLEGKSATVTVYEHAVRVSPSQGEALDSLKEGQRTVFTDRKFAEVETVDLARASAWRRHKLIFQDCPLAQVVEEINRYRRFPLIIADPRIGALPVTGLFDTQNIDAALAMIESSLALSSLRLPGGFILLYAA